MGFIYPLSFFSKENHVRFTASAPPRRTRGCKRAVSVPGCLLVSHRGLNIRDHHRRKTDHRNRRARIGVVFQQFNLFPHLSVQKNITLSLTHVVGLSQTDATHRAHELLERVGLAEKATWYPDRLSGGQQQRVALARAIACQPEVLLLDEITSALDPELVGEVLELVRSLKDDGTTIIMATHEMAFARDVADRVFFLDKGVIAESGPAHEVFEKPRDDRTKVFLQRFLGPGL